MRLTAALGLGNARVIALVGAGGKTTAMFALARAGAPAVVTTMTHLAAGQAALADHVVVWQPRDEPAAAAIENRAAVTLVTGPHDEAGTRLTALTSPQWDSLRRWCSRHACLLLVEADGSRLRPLKAPAGHEPAIPAGVDAVVVVAGLTGLGRLLDAHAVHRPDRFAELSGLAPRSHVTIEALAAVLVHPEGCLRLVPAGARRVLLLNQADTPALMNEGHRLASLVTHAFDGVALASFRTNAVVKSS
jgi:probable selenium-dependent hydroxylase accessory protein YqeC